MHGLFIMSGHSNPAKPPSMLTYRNASQLVNQVNQMCPMLSCRVSNQRFDDTSAQQEADDVFLHSEGEWEWRPFPVTASSPCPIVRGGLLTGGSCGQFFPSSLHPVSPPQ